MSRQTCRIEFFKQITINYISNIFLVFRPNEYNGNINLSLLKELVCRVNNSSYFDWLTKNLLKINEN